ncbi:DUF7373 family lipoprotein [Nocardia caishijiensis]|uniref:Uncharacterized protein n=1 Tax=Nocardia caishijiensis TaxID=184756 RepID=A0ABQ6YJ24_9NOCA|nr:hypothetical protein [Nocardia caishijiensis]KAF0845788.1 hypothetical protein FNL39_106177 [Nocardia caishijiensis]
MRRCDARLASGLLGVVLVAAAVTGCQVSGSAEPVRVDLATLDYGHYQHVPLTAPPGTEYSGRVIESLRIGEVMVNPAKADSALSVPPPDKEAVPLPTPAKVSGVLSEQARAVLTEHGMLAGFLVAGTDTAHTRQLTVLALRMPNAAAATAAAAGLDATDAAVSADNVAVSIPKYPAAKAHWRPTVASMAATIAHGAFVVSVYAVHTTPDAAALTTLISAAFDAQLPELDRFVPTPPERFADLPIDGEGMLARMVPEKVGRWSSPAVVLVDADNIAGGKGVLHARGVVYGPNATFLMGSRQQRTSANALALVGFDGLKRYFDATEARRAYERGITSWTDLRLLPGPSGIEDIRCGDAGAVGSEPEVRYVCALLHGRYIATVFAPTEQQIRQKASAQYSLLELAE